MPVSNARFHDGMGNPRRDGLVRNGPIIAVEVHVPPALARYLSSRSEPIPPPATGYALIDTGASISCIDLSAILQLNVQPVGQVVLGTAGGQTVAQLFPAHFRFPESGLAFEFESVIGVDLRGQTVMGQHIVALIGRDVLSRAIFIYNGLEASFSLAL